MELEEKSSKLKAKTISRDLLSRFSAITDCSFGEVVEFVEYWRDKGEFSEVKDYITFRCENGINARIMASIVAQKNAISANSGGNHV